MKTINHVSNSSILGSKGGSPLEHTGRIRTAARLGLAMVLFVAAGCDQPASETMATAAGQPSSGKSDASDAQSTEEYEENLERVDHCVDALEELTAQTGREWMAEDAASQPECADIDVQRDEGPASEDEGDDRDKSTGYIAFGECSNVCFNWSGRVAYQRSTRQYSHSHRETALENAIVEAEYAVELLAHSACGNYGQTYGCTSWIAN